MKKQKALAFASAFSGKSDVRGYNAPCFDRMVHYFMGSVLMRWDNEDRKDRRKRDLD